MLLLQNLKKKQQHTYESGLKGLKNINEWKPTCFSSINNQCLALTLTSFGPCQHMCTRPTRYVNPETASCTWARIHPAEAHGPFSASLQLSVWWTLLSWRRLDNPSSAAAYASARAVRAERWEEHLHAGHVFTGCEPVNALQRLRSCVSCAPWSSRKALNQLKLSSR